MTWILPELVGLCKLCVYLLMKLKMLLLSKANAFVMCNLFLIILVLFTDRDYGQE